MEVSSCGFNPCLNHSLLDFGPRKGQRCQVLGHRKCSSRAVSSSGSTVFSIDERRGRGFSKPHFLSFVEPGENFTSAVIFSRSKKRRAFSGSLVVRAAQNHSNDPSDEKEEKEGPENSSDSQGTDWRAFRARLIANERSVEEQDQPSTSDASKAPENFAKSLGARWAHPILKPEAGCVLIATDKLDELSIFERTVIILLSAGSSKGNEGPFGLILNRPLPHVLKDIRPQDQALAEAFGESQVHFGGPLVSDLILLLQGASARKGYQEVVPGIFYSSAEGLDQAVSMIKDKASGAEDFRFFFGYAGWAIGQLEREVEDGYWCVAACSTNLFISGSAANLWEEVLKLMGGQYAELSKKPKKRWFK
ncbi:uncharacterized protein LOC9637727 [Selaginella moellendorffii]|nr:uncharacterized protein LOC9637727 [Selaginella moellendorffii]|eukprot:XP_002974931.2 uncharacterized protein LOC9637727 [Selaginella moellendorffii]